MTAALADVLAGLDVAERQRLAAEAAAGDALAASILAAVSPPEPAPVDPHAPLRLAVLGRAEAAGWPAVTFGRGHRHLGGEPGWRAWASGAIAEDLAAAWLALPEATP